MYREGFQKNTLKLVWGENKAARDNKHARACQAANIYCVWSKKGKEDIKEQKERKEFQLFYTCSKK